ncbi:MAG: hypothetical protein CR975_04165 [Gammaproteobacteria bacterium]|nr:MAG: hypothetical protein CR975_04165 [Gammaproteobacteria bacterium]
MTPLQKLEHRIWQASTPTVWEKVLRVLIAVLRIINRSQIKLFATSLTYGSLLAIVPLLAVLFTLLKSFGIDTFLQKILMEMLAPMGDSGKEVGQYLLQFVNNAQTGLLGGVGMLFLFYSIFTLFRKIEVALNQIWHIHQLRSSKKQLISYLGALMLTVLVGALVIAGNVFFYQKLVQPEGEGNAIIVSLLMWGKRLLSVILTASVLAVVYSSVINTQVRFRAAFSGGLFCALLWLPLTAGFTALIAGSHNYSLIYSSFAGMIILLLWLDILWLLFLSGGLVAYFSQYPALLRAYNSKQLNPAEQEYFANRLLHIIIEHFEQGKGVVKLSQLINCTGLNRQQVLNLLAPFLSNKVIVSVGESHTYLLAMDRQKISDEFICQTIRGQVRGVSHDSMPEHLDNSEDLTYTGRQPE